MPIEKVKIEHKFGIISQTQRLMLEDRLQRRTKQIDAPSTYSRKRNLYEINEDFVSKFNDSNFEDQDVLVPVASKMLTRVKRRAGIKDGGQGNHVDIPKAWAELTLLAQLNHKELQEECLEVLITSLSQAPVLQSHIPSLFFLGKSILHWLKRTGLNQPFLRTGEIKLTKIGYLVFLRLYHFYLTNQLQQDYNNEKESLLGYLAGVSEQQYIYRYFPNALLSLRFMTEVGHLICKGVHLASVKRPKFQSEQLDVGHPEEEEPNEITSDVLPGLKGKSPKYFGMEKITEEDALEPSYSPTPIRSLTTTETIHDTTATLWHALDVWRSTAHKGIGFQQALQGLSICGTGLANESWLDVSCAFLALTDASTSNLSVLQTFQALAAGAFPKPTSLAEAHAHHLHLCSECHSTYIGESIPVPTSHEDHLLHGESDFISAGPTPSFVKGLREFARLGLKDGEESTETESLRSNDDKQDTSSEASFADISSVESEDMTHRKSSKLRRSSKQRMASKTHISDDLSSSDDDEPLKADIINVFKKQGSSRKDRHGTGVRFQTDPTGDGQLDDESWSQIQQGNLEREQTKGSLLSGHTLGSTVTIPLPEEDESTARTPTSILDDLPGIHGWPWEIAFLYAESMTVICLHGTSSLIQKVALLGNEAYRKPGIVNKKTDIEANGMGLADLLKFQLRDSKDSACKDWGWRVRFSAMQGLVRVSRHGSGDSTKDGMRGVAWNLLMRHHSIERDMRVLEALKLAKIESEIDDKSSPASPHISTLQTHLARSLSTELLPRLPPVVNVQDTVPRLRTNKLTRHPTRRVHVEQTRPSLRQEILLATAAYEPPVGYNARMNSQLMDVIKDQWSKQLYLEQEIEDAEKRKREKEKILGLRKTKKSVDMSGKEENNSEITNKLLQ